MAPKTKKGRVRVHFSKTSHLSKGFALALGALAAGIVLRLALMFFFYDGETGFYTDGGVAAWLGLLVPGLLAGGASWFFGRKTQSYGPYVRKKNGLPAILAYLSGIILFQCGGRQLVDYKSFRDTGFFQYDVLQQKVIFWLFVVMCFLFGMVQLVTGAALTTGRNPFRQAPLLYAVGVLWGISYLIVVYVFYAKSSCFVENFFAVAGTAVLLIALLYACKLFSGVDDGGAVKRLYMAGSFLLAWEAPYLTANLIAMFAGNSYYGELPADYQLTVLCVTAFLGALMPTVFQNSREAWEKEPEADPAQEEA